jgi:hypothetical protein
MGRSGGVSLNGFMMVYRRMAVVAESSPALRNNEESRKKSRLSMLQWETALTSLSTMTKHIRPSNLFHIVRSMRQRQATNPRDKIYAFVGLASNSKEFEKADYGKSTEMIYLEFAVSVVSKYPGLIPQMLVEAGRDQQRLSVPSWVPDWSFGGEYYHLGYPIEFGQFGPEVLIDNEVHDDQISTTSLQCHTGQWTLNVRGWQQGAICAVGPTRERPPLNEDTALYSVKMWILNTLMALQQYMPDLAPLLDPAILLGLSAHPPQNQKDVIHRFAKTIIANSFTETDTQDDSNGNTNAESSDPNYGWSVRDYLSMFNTETSRPGGTTRLQNAYYSMIHKLASDHKVCVTDKGLLGLVPSGTQVEDAIVILENVRAPMILRKVKNEFVMIGTAYIETLQLATDDPLDNRLPDTEVFTDFPLV